MGFRTRQLPKRDVMSDSDPPVRATSEEGEGERTSSTTGRRKPSIIGLSIVSGLNVICLAFIAYHFAGHQTASVAPTGETPITDVTPDDGTGLSERLSQAVDEEPSRLEFASGNVAFAPTSNMIVQIASGYVEGGKADDVANGDQIERGVDKPETVAKATLQEEPPFEDVDGPPVYWIQLGALSKESTALRYWTTLKQRHDASLHDRKPRIFGPPKVGGRLYHIRLGPMSADEAASLCENLREDGADCFSLGPENAG